MKNIFCCCFFLSTARKTVSQKIWLWPQICPMINCPGYILCVSGFFFSKMGIFIKLTQKRLGFGQQFRLLLYSS